MQVDLYGRFSLMAGWQTPPPWAESANDGSNCYGFGRFGKIIDSLVMQLTRLADLNLNHPRLVTRTCYRLPNDLTCYSSYITDHLQKLYGVNDYLHVVFCGV